MGELMTFLWYKGKIFMYGVAKVIQRPPGKFLLLKIQAYQTCNGETIQIMMCMMIQGTDPLDVGAQRRREPPAASSVCPGEPPPREPAAAAGRVTSLDHGLSRQSSNAGQA
ncbi:hypothetical protein AV530_010334 [Patagioenas fasciata monilis]|uniref:Uncharacterized protein n=1 Tax=Patagioenas fasciata monilis TaxID=372326 RepID=A0A1V4KEL6_PATFA|nr:hypothetical protein AV530_010334 [Patagioenas fasciata monilis]